MTGDAAGAEGLSGDLAAGAAVGTVGCATLEMGPPNVGRAGCCWECVAIAGGAAQIGAVMGKVLPQFKGRADGSTINAIAREELSKQV